MSQFKSKPFIPKTLTLTDEKWFYSKNIQVKNSVDKEQTELKLNTLNREKS